MESKRCLKCQAAKELSEFSPSRQQRDGLQPYCKACRAEHARQRRIMYPDRTAAVVTRSHLKRKYGISVAQYDSMRKVQCYRCAVCGRSESDLGRQLVVDHCHETGRVRGLLCYRCNQLCGSRFGHLDLLDRAAAYIRSHYNADDYKTPLA